jgi:protein gp37
MKLQQMTARKSLIEWCGRTWELTEGCTRVSAECINCYAEYLMGTRLKRFGLATYDAAKGARWTGNFNMRADRLSDWRKWGKLPELVFVCSRSDLFHEKCDRGFLFQVFAEFGAALKIGHTFQVLTKRIERAAELLPGIYADLAAAGIGDGKPWPNVWIGTSIGCADAAQRRLSDLIQTPAAVRWISAEPLLDDITPAMADAEFAKIDHCVTGGETARPLSNARRTPIASFRNLRDMCRRNNIAFYFKQWGNWGEDGQFPRHKSENGRLLDGIDHKAYPKIEGQVDWNYYFDKRYLAKTLLEQITE